jgi:hypothetical protein
MARGLGGPDKAIRKYFQDNNIIRPKSNFLIAIFCVKKKIRVRIGEGGKEYDIL